MSKDLYLSDERYRAALVRLRGLVERIPLHAVDSTTPGDKYTECAWGLCSDDKLAWPDAADHLWPDQFDEQGRVAPLYRRAQQKCPLDRRELADPDPNGCFHTCRVFQRRRGNPEITREQALALYDARIAEVSK